MGSHKCAPVSNELTALWYEPADALKHPALNLGRRTRWHPRPVPDALPR